ncbi:MAG: hypothetical protein K8823_455 [Cenarchaeum symbiont of Oopsacas minuta]|nr:hypothetical protein [Cenarchaeum symbiont of Oopsacas minuta]
MIVKELTGKLQSNVKNMQKGLQPKLLAFWYEKIISDAKEMAPSWLQDKIAVKQDSILPQKFNLDMSKRAVRYFVMAIDGNIDAMPYTTAMYFMRVQEELDSEISKSLV